MSDTPALPDGGSVRFVLDGEVHAATGVAPTRTVLQYLREDLGRCGTKEGCAEGDCGACTVVVGEIADGALRYRAVNSCIQFVPTLDGKALFTVESLKGRDASLHPVQQAMVETHGSQCGFCTPGFVMSLFALYKTRSTPSRGEINDALAGNLCRCTGYRPIVDAACAMYELGGKIADERRDAVNTPAGVNSAQAAADERRIVAALQAITRREGVTFKSAAASFHAPRSLDELARLREALPEARIVAGSTDVGLWVTKQHRDLGDLIYTGNVRELGELRRSATHLEIGAAVTVTDAMPALVAAHPDFDELFRRYGSPPIRNAATLGGNIANGSPIGDSMPGLIALGATLVLRKGAQIRELALEAFYLDYQKTALAPGELVERVRVPLGGAGRLFKTYKISKRFDQDISALCAAFAIDLDAGVVRGARIAYGGMAATPKRASGAERALIGQPWNEASVRNAMQALDADFAPIADMRASAQYRREVARNLLLKCWIESGGGDARTRLYEIHDRTEASL